MRHHLRRWRNMRRPNIMRLNMKSIMRRIMRRSMLIMKLLITKMLTMKLLIMRTIQITRTIHTMRNTMRSTKKLLIKMILTLKLLIMRSIMKTIHTRRSTMKLPIKRSIMKLPTKRSTMKLPIKKSTTKFSVIWRQSTMSTKITMKHTTASIMKRCMTQFMTKLNMAIQSQSTIKVTNRILKISKKK